MLNVLMPLAGRGSRFADQGIATPKPLIEVAGQPMVQRALQSLTGLSCSMQITFCVLEEHIREAEIDQRLLAIYPQAQIVRIPSVTSGAVETCLLARAHLRDPVSDQMQDDDALLVLDCDLEFRSAAFLELIQSSLVHPDERAGALLYFESTDPRYSFAELQNGRVVRTAEKEAISSHALAGAYFFSRVSDFARAGAEVLAAVRTGHAKESYLSMVYNRLIDPLIKSGGQVDACRVDEYASFGTPEELARYLARPTPAGA